MFVKSLFIIRSLVLCCCISSVLNDESFEKSETKTIPVRTNFYKDLNHPGNVVHTQDLHWSHYILDDKVKKKVGECKSINISLIPAYSDTHLKIFHEDYRQWWAIFEYCQSEVIQRLKLQIENFTKAVRTNKEKAALISRLSTELHQISEKRIVYEKKVVVNESDVKSVIRALQAWGVHDDKVLNAARAVHLVWDGDYSKDNVIWPRKVPSDTPRSS